jgi:hypothetical protein
MDAPELDLDKVFLGAVEAVVLAALEQIGEDPEARIRFFRRLLAVADEEAVRRRLSLVAPSTRRVRGLAPAVVPASGRARRRTGTPL